MVFIPVVWLYKYILLVYRKHNNSVNDNIIIIISFLSRDRSIVPSKLSVFGERLSRKVVMC
jgi:hypothetical protein